MSHYTINSFMRNQLPEHIDPWSLTGQSLCGAVALTGMTRLRELVHAMHGKATVDLRFGRDEQALHTIEGAVEAVVELICQRCMQPYRCTLKTRPRLGLLLSEHQAQSLPADYDPLIVVDGLDLTELVEDELILALPLIPRHPDGVCVLPLLGSAPAAESDTRRPFADLGRLLRPDGE